MTSADFSTLSHTSLHELDFFRIVETSADWLSLTIPTDKACNGLSPSS